MILQLMNVNDGYEGRWQKLHQELHHDSGIFHRYVASQKAGSRQGAHDALVGWLAHGLPDGCHISARTVL